MTGRGHIRDATVPEVGLVAFVWVFAILGSAQKYGGTGVALALLVGTPLVAVVLGRALSTPLPDVSRYAPDAVALLLAIVVVAAFVVIYPHADTHAPGAGSDRDDAATIGARALLHGRDPYGLQTYLGNSISQLPTLLFLAVPFVRVFGSSAYQLVIWVPLAYVLWRWLSPRGDRAVVLYAFVLVSPAVLRDVLTGGDLLPNAILVAAAVACAHRFARRPAAAVAGGVFVGIALATRVNYAYVLVPLVLGIAAAHGWRRAALSLASAVATAAAIVIPFALTSGGRQAWAHNDKLASVPGGPASVVVVALLLAVALAWRSRPVALPAVFAQASIVQLFFLVVLVVVTSVSDRRVDFSWLVSSYGLSVLVLAVTALAALEA